MTVLVRKMDKLGLLRFVMIFYSSLLGLLALAMPITIICLDVTLLANPVLLGITLISMLFFGSIGYLTFVYKKLPEALAETDGEFLYIHGKKEGKIPLSSLAGAYSYVDVPYMFQPGFFREFLIHIFSYNYGDVILEVPEYGTFKMRFVANAEEVGISFANFIEQYR